MGNDIEVPDRSAKSVFYSYETGAYEEFEPEYEIDSPLKKTLFTSGDQYVAFMASGYMDVLGCVDSLENFLGVEFAIRHKGDLYYKSDYDGLSPEKLDEVEGLDVDLTTYKLSSDDEPGWPASFPCVAVYWLEDGKDRMGPLHIEAIEFVYPSDMCDTMSPDIHVNTMSRPVVPAAGKVSHEPQEEEAEVV